MRQFHGARQDQLHSARRCLADGKSRLTAQANHGFDGRLFHCFNAWLSAVNREQAALDRDKQDNPQPPKPFITGAALRKEHRPLFVGRRIQVGAIDQHLISGKTEPLVVWGQRRMGKSSLINMLPDLLGSATTVVKVSFQTMGQNPKYEENPVDYVVAATAVYRPNPPATAMWEQAMVWFTSLDGELAREDRRMLICLDEVERYQEAIAAGKTDTSLLEMIRAVGDNLSRVRFLLATAYPLHLLGPHWTDKLISVRQIHVTYWDAAVTERFIRKPTPDFPNIYPDGGVASLAQQTAGHPYLTQLVLDKLTEALIYKKRIKASEADLVRAVDEMVHEATCFHDIWRQLLTENQRNLLIHAAWGASLPRTRDTIDLEDLDFLVAGENGYHLAVPIFARWIQKTQPPRCGAGQVKQC